MNALNNLDKTDREYSLLMTWLDSGGQTQVKITADHWAGICIHVDGGASKSMFYL